MKQLNKLFFVAILGMVMGCGYETDDLDLDPDFSEIAGNYYGEFSYVTLEGTVTADGYSKVTVDGDEGIFSWEDSSGQNQFSISFVRDNDYGCQVYVEQTLAGTTTNGNIYWVDNGTDRDGYFTSRDGQFIVLAQATIGETVVSAVSFTGLKQ